MLQNHLIVLALASVVALAAPSLFERYQAEIMSGQPESLNTGPAVVEAAMPPSAPDLPRQTRIAGDRAGHFRIDAVMNGRNVPVLVDTGASTVALDESTAQRLGIRLSAQDFVYPVQTANGVAKAAPASIAEIAIGTIIVRNVDAMVIRGAELPQSLLGMSFLKRLKGYSVENGDLTLRD